MSACNELRKHNGSGEECAEEQGEALYCWSPGTRETLDTNRERQERARSSRTLNAKLRIWGLIL